MSTYRELIYIVLDEVKQYTDDTRFTENHIRFLLDKYRAFILKKTYNDGKIKPSSSNYSTICIDVDMSYDSCNSYVTGKSTKPLPDIMSISNTNIFLGDSSESNIEVISDSRMDFAGESKYSSNIIYASITSDRYVKIKSKNIGAKYIKEIKVSAIFEGDVSEYSCNKDKEGEGSSNDCYLDSTYPLEESLQAIVIQQVFSDIYKTLNIPEDTTNNSSEGRSNLPTSINPYSYYANRRANTTPDTTTQTI